MNYFASTETYRISLHDFDGSEEYVDIKDELTDKDERQLAAAAAAAGATFSTRPDGSAQIEGIAGSIAYAEALLQRCIVGWSFRSPRSGQPIQVSPANISLLKGITQFLVEQATAHYNAQRMTPEERKNSSGPPSQRDSTVAPLTTDSPASSSANGSASTPTPLSQLVVESAPFS